MVLWAVPNMRLKPKSVSRLMYLSSIPFIPQNIFLLQKYNFYMKSANKSTEFLQIEIYLLLYADVVSISPGVVLDDHHSLCEQAIQFHMNSKCCVQLCGFTSVPVPMTLLKGYLEFQLILQISQFPLLVLSLNHKYYYHNSYKILYQDHFCNHTNK